MPYHPEVMLPDQQTVLSRLGPLMDQWGFYLGGGTAVAAYLGHRRSVDLDWFTGERLDDPMRLAQDLRDEGFDVQGAQTARGTLHATAFGVRVSFLEFRYPLLRPLASWPDEWNCIRAAIQQWVRSAARP